MMPSFESFAHELTLIKLAEAKEEPDKKKLFKQLAINAIGYGTGFGLGTGTGWLLGEKLLPKKFPKMTTGKRALISTAGGVLTGLGALASYEAMRHARRLEDERSKRDS